MLSIDGTSCSLESHLEVIIKVKFSTTARRANAVRGDPRSRLSTPIAFENSTHSEGDHQEMAPGRRLQVRIGYGGQIIRVTSLNFTGCGSLPTLKSRTK